MQCRQCHKPLKVAKDGLCPACFFAGDPYRGQVYRPKPEGYIQAPEKKTRAQPQRNGR